MEKRIAPAGDGDAGRDRGSNNDKLHSLPPRCWRGLTPDGFPLRPLIHVSIAVFHLDNDFSSPAGFFHVTVGCHDLAEGKHAGNFHPDFSRFHRLEIVLKFGSVNVGRPSGVGCQLDP